MDLAGDGPGREVIIDPTVSAAASEDVWLEDGSNKNYLGANVGLLVAKAANYPKKRIVVKFNVSGAGIPTGVTVINAQMKLKYYKAVRVGSTAWVDRWVQVHQLLKSWDESQATRYVRLTGVSWNAQYVGLDDSDAKSEAESMVLIQQDYPKWKSWELTGLTQKWLDGTASNHGVLLWATNEDTDGYDLRFRASEYATASERPVLEVTYSEDLKTVYFLKDHLGSIRATVDEDGDVVGYDDYDAWGLTLANRSLATPWNSVQGTAAYKFTGKERDDDFGLDWDYFGARYYDAEIGRWLVVDPRAADYPSLSPYVYVSNNPLNATEPDGEGINSLAGALIGGAVFV